jgi:hypothetical protein
MGIVWCARSTTFLDQHLPRQHSLAKEEPEPNVGPWEATGLANPRTATLQELSLGPFDGDDIKLSLGRS